MLARIPPTLARTRKSEQPIPLADLNMETFLDPDLAEDAAADCVRLLQASPEDFEAVRSQKWYKRLWTQLVQGETRRRAGDCRSVPEAQDLLAQLLNAQFEHTARVCVLANLISQGLGQTSTSGNQFTRLVIDLDGERTNVIQEADRCRAQGTHDPANEYTWSVEHRLLMLKVMAAAAVVDGHLAVQERRLLDFKLLDLELDEAARSEAERYLDRVTPLRGEIQHVESAQMREVIFRHAAAMVLADGSYNLSEKYFIRDLARALKIGAGSADVIFKALEPVRSHMPAERVAELASSGRKTRTTSTQAASTAGPTTTADRPPAVEAALAELAPRLREWTGEFAGYAYHELVSFLVQREAKINQGSDENCNLEEVLNVTADIFDPEDLRRDLSNALTEAHKIAAGTGAYLAGEVDLLLEGELFGLIGDQFEEISESSTDLDAAVQKLLAKVAEVRQNIPTPLLGGVKGGAIGAASLFLLGPLWWLGGAAGAWFAYKLDGDKIERMVKSLGRSYDRVWETASRWDKKAADSLLFLGDQIAEALLESMRVKGCLDTVRRAQKIVESDLAEWATAEEQ